MIKKLQPRTHVMMVNLLTVLLLLSLGGAELWRAYVIAFTKGVGYSKFSLLVGVLSLSFGFVSLFQVSRRKPIHFTREFRELDKILFSGKFQMVKLILLVLAIWFIIRDLFEAWRFYQDYL